MAKKTLYELTYWSPTYSGTLLIRASNVVAVIDSIQPGELTYWLDKNLAEVKQHLVDCGVYVDMKHHCGVRIDKPIIREV